MTNGASDLTIWLVIVVLGIGTFLIRWSFLGALGGRDLHPQARDGGVGGQAGVLERGACRVSILKGGAGQIGCCARRSRLPALMYPAGEVFSWFPPTRHWPPL